MWASRWAECVLHRCFCITSPLIAVRTLIRARWKTMIYSSVGRKLFDLDLLRDYICRLDIMGIWRLCEEKIVTAEILLSLSAWSSCLPPTSFLLHCLPWCTICSSYGALPHNLYQLPFHNFFSIGPAIIFNWVRNMFTELIKKIEKPTLFHTGSQSNVFICKTRSSYHGFERNTLTSRTICMHKTTLIHRSVQINKLLLLLYLQYN